MKFFIRIYLTFQRITIKFDPTILLHHQLVIHANPIFAIIIHFTNIVH